MCICNDKSSWDDFLITLNVMREQRELDGVSLVNWAIYLYTISICLCVHLSNYWSFQKVPSCDLSCNQVIWSHLILSYLSFSIIRILHLVHLRIALFLPIPLAVLFWVWLGNLWQCMCNKSTLWTTQTVTYTPQTLGVHIYGLYQTTFWVPEIYRDTHGGGLTYQTSYLHLNSKINQCKWSCRNLYKEHIF